MTKKDKASYESSPPCSCRVRKEVTVRLSKIDYGVATISRLLKIIGLFCRISSLLQGSFAKETCNLKEPTNRSHHICEIDYLRYIYEVTVLHDRESREHKILECTMGSFKL